MSRFATLTKVGADGATVRYTDAQTGAGGTLAEGLVIRASVLPDPPPDIIRIFLDWAEAAAGTGRPAPTSGAASPGSGAASTEIREGERVEVVKSRVSGVKNPPQWLEQYVGRTGIVLWTTADGAMVDLDADTTWFSYAELKPRD